MRGHIKKRGNTYLIKVGLGKNPTTGEYEYLYRSVKGTKKDAERRLSEILYQIDTGSFIQPSKTTLAEYLSKWLKDYVWPNLAPRTAEGYEHIIKKHLAPGLGNHTLTELRPEHIQHYYSEKLENGRLNGKGGLSPRSVRHHHVTLHDALQHAVKMELIARNPCDAVTPPRYQRHAWHSISEFDVNAFIEAAKQTPYYEIFYLALFTGMRRSEVLALRWVDVDLLLCQIHVTRSLHHLRTGENVIRAPKSAKGRRMIPISPSTAMILQAFKDKEIARWDKLERPLKEDDLIFRDRESRPILPDTVTHAWHKLIKRSGLEGVRLHDARHTHASILLKQGVHAKVVQERLGHASIQLTLDTYSHVAPGLQEQAARGFDSILAKTEANENG